MSVKTATIALQRGFTTLETTCLSCGKETSREYLYTLDHGVCGACAKRIAEKYDLEHSGAMEFVDAQSPLRKSPIPQELRWKIFERDGFACRQCGVTGVELTIDHIKARAKGGSDDEENLQTLCRPCNGSKGARDV